MTGIRPAQNYLFCRPLEAETTTKSGFQIAGEAAEKPKVGHVVATGLGVVGYTAGDKVIYKDYATTDVVLDGDDYFLVASDDVLGVLLES